MLCTRFATSHGSDGLLGNQILPNEVLEIGRQQLGVTASGELSWDMITELLPVRLRFSPPAIGEVLQGLSPTFRRHHLPNVGAGVDVAVWSIPENCQKATSGASLRLERIAKLNGIILEIIQLRIWISSSNYCCIVVDLWRPWKCKLPPARESCSSLGIVTPVE